MVWPPTSQILSLKLSVNRPRYPLCSAVLILKPRVGAISLISSPMNFLTMVVFPALSSPLM